MLSKQISPVLNTLHAPFTAIKHGIPYSLATTAPCEIVPPISVTRPEIIGKYGVHPMSVAYVIKISPF